MHQDHAAAQAAAQIAAVQDEPHRRLAVAADFYPAHVRDYQRAELYFLRWELARGVLHPKTGSGWWRAINDRLLHDKLAARLLWDAGARSAVPTGVRHWLEFLDRPSPAAWYRAHNRSVVTGYLDSAPLAESELLPERFMMNVTLSRALFTQALIEQPALALGRFGRLGRRIGDPRGHAVRVFLDMRNVFPELYPMHGLTIAQILAEEGRAARVIDYGLILPRLSELYAFAATSLGEPRLTTLIDNGMFSYGDHSVGRAELRPDALSRIMTAATGFSRGRRRNPPGIV
ncbi:hypothetical protein [Nocardia sp. XZ_19_385]|uniref:hypothetical protein n=1 Tax=Nocardia sp. XZ_19_385 TaxID=2769488 RepID=UPI00189051A0|nr:hypothetical protein [Nocardia sp. XZ_19_385]